MLSEDNKKNIGELINKENSKQPLTDEQIAQKLSILRETVTGIRKEMNIPNSRDRKKKNIKKIIKKIKSKYPNIAVSELKSNLEDQGFRISRNYLIDIINNIDNDDTDNEKINESEYEKDVFLQLIGHEGSLAKSIKQGKASMMYPSYGLPTLIVGGSGTGKTLFVECMYKYAVQKKLIDNNAPFISLNCADYSDNPQLLLSILYGHKKGSFTGADQDTVGIVEQANGGVLFLDEIHRLPPKGQEMLFTILDKGKFRRLGELSNDRESNIYFIGATTENIESSLLLTFRRRIPMIIELPLLKERSVQEKIQLIKNCFQEEANRTNSKIFLNAKVIEAFAFKEFPGNIGQLKSEIQVTCANAYVEKINSKKDEIHIGFNNMLYYNLFNNNDGNREGYATKFNGVFKDMLFIPNIFDRAENFSYKDDSDFSYSKDIYEKVEEKYYELKKWDIPPKEIEKVMWDFILYNFNVMSSGSISDGGLKSLNELQYLVNDKIFNVLKKFMESIKEKYSSININEKIIIYLAIHLDEAIKRIKSNQNIINPNIIYIKEKLKKEFEIACDLAFDLRQELNVKIPEDEVGYIAMYINETLKIKRSKNRIGIIVISHGKIASEMINVTNKLMDVDFPIAIDMPLNVNPMKTLEQVIEICKNLDTPEGILFFVDMGSLVNFGDIIKEKIGIKTKTIDRVDLVSVMEAVRKVYLSNESLDDIYYDIVNSKHTFNMMTTDNSDKPPAIITMCLTGHGVAIKIKEILSNNYPNAKIIPLSILEDNLNEEVNNLKQQYNIPAIIGTINPCIEGINFIPFENDLKKDVRMFLDHMVNTKNNNDLKKVIGEDSILLDLDCKTKQEVIEIMSRILFNKGFVKDEFIDSVFKREKMSSTCFKGSIAIPHGIPTFVKESTVAFLRLKHPIKWDNNGTLVKLVFMPAIKSDDIYIINNVFKILKQQDKVNRLLKAKNPFEFSNILCEQI